MMNISHLKKYCNSRYEKFIEIKIENDRWLFASDGHRAVGLKTDVASDNISGGFCENAISNHSNVIKEFFDRQFTKLDSQGFMAWLFSNGNCNRCNGKSTLACEYCNNSGRIECDECEGSGIDRDECCECGGSGIDKIDCEKCDSNGTVKEECNECDGTGKCEVECDECAGCGTLDDGTDCSDCEEGTKEEDCEYCEEGKVECDCPDCEEGYIEEVCEHCEEGYIESECSDCDTSGEVECEECNGCLEVKCPECTKDIGKIFDGKDSSIIDLKFVKDLSRGCFEEISIGSSERDAIVFRSKDTMVVVMPYLATSEDKYRTYLSATLT